LYKYIDIQIPFLYTLIIVSFTYFFIPSLFKNNKTMDSFKGEAILLFSSFPKIEGLLADNSQEVFNILNSYSKLLETFIKETSGSLIYDTGKSKILAFKKIHFKENLFFKKLIDLKNNYLKIISNLDDSYKKVLKPCIIIDCNYIIYDQKTKSIFGDFLKKLYKIAKLNELYNCFALISNEAYACFKKENYFYQISKNLFCLNWQKEIVDLNKHKEFLEKVQKSFNIDDLKEYAKIIKEDKNTSFRILLKELYVILKEGKNNF
jgi:hypothetical protein